MLELVSGGMSVLGEGLADTTFGLFVFFTGLSAGFVLFFISFSSDGSVWVESVHEFAVGKRVFLLDEVEDFIVTRRFELGLNFIGVNDTGNIGGGEDGSLEVVSFLFSGTIAVSTEDVVDGSESAFSPDDEATELTSGGEFQKVESVDVSNGDTWDVAESLSEFDVFSAGDDEGTLASVVTIVSPLATATAEGAGIDDAFNVFEGADSAEPGNGVLGAFNVFNGIVEDEGEFVDAINTMTTGLDEGNDCGGSEGRADGVTFLGHIDATMPSSPGLQGGEHATLAALVAERTLA